MNRPVHHLVGVSLVFPATPSFYLIDPTGTIRRKWVGHPGESSIDAAVEKLLREAEEAAK